MLFLLVITLAAMFFCVGFLLVRRHPGWARRALPYLFILCAAGWAYIGFTAYQRRAWWFVPPVILLVLGIVEFIRQRRIAAGQHARNTS